MEGKKILFIIGAVTIVLYIALTTVPKATDTDKTLEQLESFLKQDTVSENKYVDGVYNCFNFSKDLKASAEAKGFDVHLVYIGGYGGQVNHAVVVFILGDGSQCFIEAQDDHVIKNIMNEYKDTLYITIWN